MPRPSRAVGTADRSKFSTAPTDRDMDRLGAQLDDRKVTAGLRTLGEWILWVTLAVTPWLFGCADPVYELIPALALLLLLALWAISAALQGRMRLRWDGVTLALSGLVLWTALQLIPWPREVAAWIIPTRLAQHESFQPAVEESFPGEVGRPRETTVTITIDPSGTRTFLAQSLGVLLLYLVVRNWLATRENLPQFVLVVVVNAGLLALLALAHFFSGERETILWLVPSGPGAAYGPFVCRNHYPDYVGFGLGLAVAWCLDALYGADRTRDRDTETSRTAKLGLLVFAIVLLVASLPFSLSRGGVLAALLAGLLTVLLRQSRPHHGEFGGDRTLGSVLALLGLLGLVTLMAWFGTSILADRLQTVRAGEAFDSRVPLWQDAWRLAEWTWPVGAGAGSFLTLEPTVRESSSLRGIFYLNSVHNEYLEALVDGGVVRLGLTLVLAGSLLFRVGQGYRQRAQRSVGPYLLGLWFGLAVVVIHAVTDFAIRIPAVAFLAAVAAAYAMAAATDASFVPRRQRVRRIKSLEQDAELTTPELGPDPDPAAQVHDQPDDTKILRGTTTMWLPLLFLLGAGLVMLEVANRVRVQAYQVEAEAIYYGPAEDHLEQRAALYVRRAELRPYDAQVVAEAGQALIDVATYRTWTTLAAVGGAPLSFVSPPQPMPPKLVQNYLHPGLRYLQAARRVNPMWFSSHTRLAIYLDQFAEHEPSQVHFDRAKRLLPTDALVWYASGRAALKEKNYERALADWQESLRLGTDQQTAILEAFRRRLSPEQLHELLVPKQPRSQWAAMNYLYPDRVEQAELRQPYLRELVQGVTAAGASATPEERIWLADAYDELGQTEQAAALWVELIALKPVPLPVLARYADRLEAEEQYEELVDWLLNWRTQEPNRPDLPGRLERARRGATLQAEIRR